MQTGLYDSQNIDRAQNNLELAEADLVDAVGNKVQDHIVLPYGFFSYPIKTLSLILDCSPAYLQAYYDLYGADAKSLIEGLGREILMHRGQPFDKIEVGTRYSVPWPLIDAQPFEIQYKLLDIYLKGMFMDKRWAEGKFRPITISETKQKEFDSYLKRVVATFKSAPVVEREDSIIQTAAQARSSSKPKKKKKVIVDDSEQDKSQPEAVE